MAKSWVRVPEHSGRARVPTKKPPATGHGGQNSGRHSRAQEGLFDQWMQTRVTIACDLVTHEVVVGQLVAYDTYALQVLDAEGNPCLLFKHAVIRMRPLSAPLP